MIFLWMLIAYGVYFVMKFMGKTNVKTTKAEMSNNKFTCKITQNLCDGINYNDCPLVGHDKNDWSSYNKLCKHVISPEALDYVSIRMPKYN